MTRKDCRKTGEDDDKHCSGVTNPSKTIGP